MKAHYRTTGPEIWEQTEGKGYALRCRPRHRRYDLRPGTPQRANPVFRSLVPIPGSIFKTFKETGKLIEATPYLVKYWLKLFP